jgi:hypothetical protein
VTVQGPLWYEILHIANKKLMSLQEIVISRGFIDELKPLITLSKSSAWDSIGCQLLKRANLVNVIKIHGREALAHR